MREPIPSLGEDLRRYDGKALSELYRRVFDTDDGKLILEDLRLRAYAYDSTISDVGMVDPYRACINEGARQILLTIENRIRGEE